VRLKPCFHAGLFSRRTFAYPTIFFVDNTLCRAASRSNRSARSRAVFSRMACCCVPGLLAVPRLLFLFLKLCFGPRTGHIDTRAHVVAPWQQALPGESVSRQHSFCHSGIEKRLTRGENSGSVGERIFVGFMCCIQPINHLRRVI